MAAIGDLDLSLVSAESKLSMSLANLNIDFAMIKVEAPMEYQAVGSCLSKRRKEEAEDGALHGLARKLGVLFSADLPQIPNLLRAYGQRASEISANQKFNPRGSRNHGAFADHIGADGTSIWAAATSGNAAIAVHLLACMLACLWSGPEATSILSEMAEARKIILRKRLEADAFNVSDVTAAHITFHREQLSAWDASARAWLRTADTAFSNEQHELMRTLRKFGTKFTSRSDLYTSVQHAWYRSMQVMESLLTGKPQSVFDAEPLLGLAAWHLYPDMTILGDKPRDIHQKDPLFTPGGILTLGMTAGAASLEKGVSWSLPLSHLRFYGKPVLVTRTLAVDTERITFQELKIVLLGAVTGHWFPKAGGMAKVADFLINLTDCLAPLTENGPRWLEFLTSIARDYITVKGQVREDYDRLYKLGHRRGAGFLSPDKVQLPEAFGLLDFEPFLTSLIDVEDAIALVRDQLPKLAQDLALLESGFISYRPSLVDTIGSELKKSNSKSLHQHLDHSDAVFQNDRMEEFATIYVSNPEDGHQRRVASYHADHNGTVNSWSVLGMISPNTEQVKRCKALAASTKEGCGLFHKQLDKARVQTLTEYQRAETIANNTRWLAPPFENRAAKILQHSDKDWKNVVETENSALQKCRDPKDGALYAVWHDDRPIVPMTPRSSLSRPGPSTSSSLGWPRSYLVLNNRKSEASSQIKDQASTVEQFRGSFCCRLRDIRDFGKGGSKYFVADMGCPEKHYVPCSEIWLPEPKRYQLFLGDHNKLGVWFPVGSDFSDLRVRSENLITAIKGKPSYADAVLQRLNNMWTNTLRDYKKSLDAFIYASEVFEAFPDSTIDVSVIGNSLCDASWASASNAQNYAIGTTFACLAMFESGSLNINPYELKDVLAMASSNSLYMAEYVFSDPLEPHGKHLVRRTIGSIGKPGTSFLISAKALDSLEPNYTSWKSVPYAPFDGLLEDNFATTTLHLTFTGDEQPLNIGQTGFRDKEVFLVETVVRVYDKTRWIADVDLASSLDSTRFLSKQALCNHSENEKCSYERILPITSIDSWDELLDLPPNLCIVRVRNNWLARQAVSALAIQLKKQTVLSTGNLCWKCISQSTYPLADVLIIC